MILNNWRELQDAKLPDGQIIVDADGTLLRVFRYGAADSPTYEWFGNEESADEWEIKWPAATAHVLLDEDTEPE